MRFIKDNEELKSLIDKNNNIIISDNIHCDFNINIQGNIIAWDINAWDINAWNIIAGNIIAGNITANDINALDISADDISYYAVCFAYNNITCKSIKGRRCKSKHFALDETIKIKGKRK